MPDPELAFRQRLRPRRGRRCGPPTVITEVPTEGSAQEKVLVAPGAMEPDDHDETASPIAAATVDGVLPTARAGPGGTTNTAANAALAADAKKRTG
jgi:hypothetical protein